MIIRTSSWLSSHFPSFFSMLPFPLASRVLCSAVFLLTKGIYLSTFLIYLHRRQLHSWSCLVCRRCPALCSPMILWCSSIETSFLQSVHTDVLSKFPFFCAFLSTITVINLCSYYITLVSFQWLFNIVFLAHLSRGCVVSFIGDLQ